MVTMPVSASTLTSQQCTPKPGPAPVTLSWAWPLIGPPVLPACAASWARVSGSKSPTLEPAGLAMPFSQMMPSGSTFQILPARTLSSRIMSRTEFTTARPVAKVTRLPPVTKLKPIDAVSAITGRTLS